MSKTQQIASRPNTSKTRSILSKETCRPAITDPLWIALSWPIVRSRFRESLWAEKSVAMALGFLASGPNHECEFWMEDLAAHTRIVEHDYLTDILHRFRDRGWITYEKIPIDRRVLHRVRVRSVGPVVAFLLPISSRNFYTRRLIKRVSLWPLRGPLNLLVRALALLASGPNYEAVVSIDELRQITGLAGPSWFYNQLIALRRLQRVHDETDRGGSKRNIFRLAGPSGFLPADAESTTRNFDTAQRLLRVLRDYERRMGPKFAASKPELMQAMGLITRRARPGDSEEKRRELKAERHAKRHRFDRARVTLKKAGHIKDWYIKENERRGYVETEYELNPAPPKVVAEASAKPAKKNPNYKFTSEQTPIVREEFRKGSVAEGCAGLDKRKIPLPDPPPPSWRKLTSLPKTWTEALKNPACRNYIYKMRNWYRYH